MGDDLDLERGEPDRSSSRTERARRRRQNTADKETPATGVSDGVVREQLTRAFNGLANSREARGDSELADAFREEGDAMTEGFVALTDNVKPLRMPLIIILNIGITLLAFGRVGNIILNRIAERRARRQAEREAMAGMTPDEPVEYTG